MDLYLTRFLSAATLLLLLGLIIAPALRRRLGPSAANEALRLTLAAVALCGLLAALPAPLPSARVTDLPASQESIQVRFPAALISKPAPSLAAVPESIAPGPLLIVWPIEPAVLIVWAAGALVGLVLLLRGHLLLRTLRRRSAAVALERPIPIPVRESPALNGPLLAGCVRPILYLPAAGPIREEASSLEAALAHELAHLRRNDLRWTVFASVLRALLWFHPLVHLVCRQLAQTAEEASDEAAVATTNDRRGYANLLLRLSERPDTPTPVPSIGLLRFRSRVGRRVAALLARRLTRPLSRGGRTGLCLSTLLLLLVGTSLVGGAPRVDAGASGERIGLARVADLANRLAGSDHALLSGIRTAVRDVAPRGQLPLAASRLWSATTVPSPQIAPPNLRRLSIPPVARTHRPVPYWDPQEDESRPGGRALLNANIDSNMRREGWKGVPPPDAKQAPSSYNRPRQRLPKIVQLPAGPTSLEETLRTLCRQAGPTDFVIEPGVSGTIDFDVARMPFEAALYSLCAQTRPVSFPFWDGKLLRIVPAPGPGVYDPVHSLYRLLEPSLALVFEERPEASNGQRNGILYREAHVGDTLHVNARDFGRDDAGPGITFARETHGRVERFVTDSRGRARIPLLDGRNYVYLVNDRLSASQE